MPMPANTAETFWSMASRGATAECWPWAGSFFRSGYGQYRFAGKHWRAHRLAFTLANGALQADEVVRHTCDNPACVNPAHLLRGTQAQNIADKVARGRQARGERSGRYTKPHRTARGERSGLAKLTDDCVHAIRVSYAAGAATQVELARWFHVGQSQISRITRHESRD
jgi:hypothetical protein